MARRTVTLRPPSSFGAAPKDTSVAEGGDRLARDGSSQGTRALPALNPEYARIDERSSSDLVRFVQNLVGHIGFASADQAEDHTRVLLRHPQFPVPGPVALPTWEAFANHALLTVEDIEAFVRDPTLFGGEEARWLGRPHFVLLLVFVELLGKAREHLNGLTRRHLEHYYRDVLGMEPLAAEPDRVAVMFGLAPRAGPMFLPAGTELLAGKDSTGVPRRYRTERDVLVTQARIAELRSLYVDRRVVTIPGVRRDASLTAAGAFDQALRIALGGPKPGDEVPAWQWRSDRIFVQNDELRPLLEEVARQDHTIDHAFFQGETLESLLKFATKRLYLEHHELRELVRLWERQDRELGNDAWQRINDLLHVSNPTDPRDFIGNLESIVGPLDFAADALPQVASVDDLYEHREEADVKAYIEERLESVGGFDTFVEVMTIRRRIDAEWGGIKRLIERAGRRRSKSQTWRLPPGDPMDFSANLWGALEIEAQAIATYFKAIQGLEARLSLSVESINRLAIFARSFGIETDAGAVDWKEADRIFTAAHTERAREARRETLDAAFNFNEAGFLSAVSHVMNRGAVEKSWSWEDAQAELSKLDLAPQLAVLGRFYSDLQSKAVLPTFGWSDVRRALEFVWRTYAALPEPVAQVVTWYNVYPAADATAWLDDPGGAARWRAFGGVAHREQGLAPVPSIGFAVRSPALGLSQGSRTITLTIRFRDGVDASALMASWKLTWCNEWLAVEVSTAKGWLALPGLTAEAKTATNEIELKGTLQGTDPPLVAPIGSPAPMLRVLLRPVWVKDEAAWKTSLPIFDGLEVEQLILDVSVRGLIDVHLQQEDRRLDPRKPWEPFGLQPAVGSRLYFSHPELIRGRLTNFMMHFRWMGLPESLSATYENYTNKPPFGVDLESFDRHGAGESRSLVTGAELLKDLKDEDDSSKASLNTDISWPASEEGSLWGGPMEPPPNLQVGSDIRFDDRYFCLILKADLGHSTYPSLAATMAREFAIKLASGSTPAPEARAYQVDPPYTPKVERLTVDYSTSVTIRPADLTAQDVDVLLHLLPFGESPVTAHAPTLMPRFEHAGELYLGLVGVEAPQQLALWIQVADGTSDPEVEPPRVAWSVLDGETWRPLAVRHDSTRGLLDSGVVELDLPVAVAGGALPGGRYWIRAAVDRDPGGVCNIVSIRPHGTVARFEDRGNAAEHYAQPLPPASVERLAEPNARIASVEQPYSSFGARPAEPPEVFHARVSERLRHRNRAVTAWDYERLVLQRFPQIHRALVIPGGGDGVVEVVVVPDIRGTTPRDVRAPRVAAHVLAEIREFLAAHGSAAATVRVRNPRFIPLRVRLAVRFREGRDAGYFRARLAEDLVRFLSPWAYEEGGELPVGGRVYQSRLIDFVDQREYVDYVAEVHLFRETGPDTFAEVLESYAAPEHPADVFVSVPAHQHVIDGISDRGYQQESFTGIGYMRIGLDFIVSP